MASNASPAIALIICLAPAFGQAPFSISVVGPRDVYVGSHLRVGLIPKFAQSPENLYFQAIRVPGDFPYDLTCAGALPCHTSAKGQPLIWSGLSAVIDIRPLFSGSFSAAVTLSNASGIEVPVSFSFEALPAPAPTFAAEVRIPRERPAYRNALKRWERTMLQLGEKWCSANEKMSFGYEGQVWYYDGGRVYFEIADYTTDDRWAKCAWNIVTQYRDNVIQRKGRLQGWRVFTRGLRLAYERSGDNSYRDAVMLLARNSAFAATGGSPSDTAIRETAYALEAYIDAERLGSPRNPLMSRSVDFLLGDFDLLFRRREGYSVHQTFYDALAAEALIDYYTLTEDPRIPPTIKLMLDWVMEKGWDGTRLVYNPDPPGPHCDPKVDGGCQSWTTTSINMLAPAFAWYWSITGDVKYLSVGDEMFSHSLDQDISYSGKIFCQNYRYMYPVIRGR